MPRYRRKQLRRRKGGMRRRGPLSRQVYHGMKFMKETILKTVVKLPAGQTPAVFLYKFSCSFNDISNNISYMNVPALTAIPALYSRYSITGVKWTFIPAFTQSSAGSAPTARVCYAINRDPQDVLTGEADIVRQDDVKFTNTTRKFSVYVKNPRPTLAVTAQQQAGNGLGPQQYAQPAGGAGAGGTDPNQVAFTLADNKWIWLPTRVIKQDVGGPTSAQYPDHVGLDVVITANLTAALEAPQDVYYVYQTLYLALKEQD